MKDKLAKIRLEVEKLAKLVLCDDDRNIAANEHLETVCDELDSLEPLADHLEDYNDTFDVEAWADELQHMVAELDD